MIDPNKVTEAVSEFLQNPGWNEVFINAPAGAMERLAISFYFSKHHDSFAPEDFEEYRNLREELERSLDEEDLNYLIENTDKPDAKQHYEELLQQLQGMGGKPTGQLRFDKKGGEEEAVQPQGEEQPPPEEEGEEKVEATETKETPQGEETEMVVEEDKTEQMPLEEDGEKKKDLTKPDEKYDTALSVALEYLQNEKNALEGNKKKKEPPKTN